MNLCNITTTNSRLAPLSSMHNSVAQKQASKLRIHMISVDVGWNVEMTLINSLNLEDYVSRDLVSHNRLL